MSSPYEELEHNFGKVQSKLKYETSYDPIYEYTMRAKHFVDDEVIPDGDLKQKLKHLELRTLFAILNLSPKSEPRKTKKHLTKREIDNGNNCAILTAHALCVCHISYTGKPDNIDEDRGGSYLDMNSKKMYYYKSRDVEPIVFDFSSIWSNITSHVDVLKQLSNNKEADMVLFSNKKYKKYNVYCGTNKKNCAFANDFLCKLKEQLMKYVGYDVSIEDKPITIDVMIRRFFTYNNSDQESNIKSECTTPEKKIKQSNVPKDVIVQKEQEHEQEQEYGCTKDMYEEIFSVLGIFPKDCPCREYALCLHKRCIVQGKSRKGLRPKHKVDCSRKLSEVV